MGIRSKSSSSRTRRQNATQEADVRRVDPVENRPPNADEQSPETLVPEIVRNTLSRTSADSDRNERDRRIAQRAYELAQARGFAPGAELEDWLRAEREIDEQNVKQVPPEDQFTG